jgi:TrmH family RNA methyltransferase
VGVIASRDNPRVKRWRALSLDARERRKQQRAIIEGENLILAFLQTGGRVEQLMLSKTGSRNDRLMALAGNAGKSQTVLADPLFRSIAGSETPAGIAAEIALPVSRPDLPRAAACVLLEGVQDAGNVGAILRSAAAFGLKDAVLGKGCADLWSPKVLRAAAGAHFIMRFTEGSDLAAAIDAFGGRVACTAPLGGVPLEDADLSGRIGWLFGAEGRGVSAGLAARAALRVTITLPGGVESLNVAAAAAICFREFSRRGAAG